MRKWKTEKHHWNAVKLYQWFLLWKREGVPARKTGNVRGKFFPRRLFRLGIEEYRETCSLEARASLHASQVERLDGECSVCFFLGA